MRVDELAKIANISARALQLKAKKALYSNESIDINGTKYRVIKKKIDGSKKPIYWFEELNDIKVELNLTQADKRWLRASESKKREAILKASLVSLWERREKGIKFSQFMANLPSKYETLGEISEATFFRWVKAVRDAKAKNIAPSYALLDTRGGKKAHKISEEMGKFIEKLILQKPHRKAKRVWEYLLDNFGEQTPSYSTIKRYIEQYKANNVLVMAVANNPTKAVGSYRPAFGKADASVAYRNQLWELDATPADIITSDGKRMIISAAIDVYSRRVVCVLVESASFESLSYLFRKAIQKLGIPEAVKTDNGKDYRSNNFEMMCQRLGIDQILTPPYAGYHKPHIERFFRTLSHELFEELDGYIGHSVADREKLQDRHTFEAKLKAQERWRQEMKNGNEFAKKFALKKENKGTVVEVPLSSNELKQWIDKWVLMYENRLHRGINTKPIDKWNSSKVPVRRVSDIRILNVLVGLSEVKKVTKKGIRLNNIYYTATELWEFVGERVIVLTDDDLSKVYVYDSDYNYICTAINDEHYGKSRAEYIKATKKFDKKVKAIVKMLTELREESDSYMQEHIEAQIEQLNTNIKEIGYEEKTDVTKAVIEALEENKQEVHEELKDDSVVANKNGRPQFNTPYDRFVWEIKNNCVSEKTLKLAKKYKDSWEAAQKAAS